MLATTLAQSFGSVLPGGHYPRGVVFVDLPSELLDVNVHPQKTEVRFIDPRATADAVYSIASRELATALSLPPSPRNRFARTDTSRQTVGAPLWAKRAPDIESMRVVTRPDTPPALDSVALRPGGVIGSESVSAPPQHKKEFAETSLGQPSSVHAEAPRAEKGAVTEDNANAGRDAPWILRENTPAAAGLERVDWSRLRFVAQLRQTFLLCEGPSGLYVLDQHAAAERVAFQKLLDQYRSHTMAAQTLLFPANIEMSQEEVELIEQRLDSISAVGLDVRIRGSRQVSVHAIPRLLQRASPERLLCDLVGELARSGGRGFSAAIEHALSLMACHGCLRAGDTISASEAQALLAALDTVDFAGHCAHGRPVVTVVSYHELERKVGRR
jgi:DNA mismatch repair protein MutL